MKQYYMIGNTHFDPVWLWRWDEAMASIRATFRSALNQMKEDPNFVYSFATPPVFEWIKKVDPEMFKEICQRVNEGRWELAEGWWVQPDCYSACGESYVRQGLYGQKYLADNFGKKSDTVFNIDSFGHSPALPQILRKSHVKNYCLTRPESRHVSLERQLFNWKGLDGTTVSAYRAVGAYAKTVKEAIFQQEDPNSDALIVFGVTDHGGAPTKELIAEINSTPNAEFSSVSNFFSSNKNTDYTFFGELLTGDFGPYSNHPRIKKLNRTAEYAVLNAERASLLADTYDRDTIAGCWKDVLFNQFHDILGGASIKEAYTDAEHSLGRAIQTAGEQTHFSLQKITSGIRTVGKNPDDPWNLVIWNLNGSEFDGYLETEVQWVHEFPWYEKGIRLEDEKGTQIPCQVIAAKAVIPGFRSRFVFKANIPSMGYRVFKVVKTNEDIPQTKPDSLSFETNILKIEFDSASGNLVRITDKATGKIIYSDILRPVVYGDDGDTWAFNVEKYDSSPENFTPGSIRVIESGKLRTVVRADYSYKNSLLTLYYTFYADENYFDLRYRVNWNESHCVLKLESKTKSNATNSAVPYGIVCREETEADVPMSNFVSADGISYLCDSVFSYNSADNKLGLTVLRSPIYGDLRIRDIDLNDDYDILSQGITEGNIRISRQGYSPDLTDSYLNPPVIICESNHEGSLPTENSFADVDNKSVSLTAVKKCEFGCGDIVRLFEHSGKKQNAELYYLGGQYSFQLDPFEIKTVKIENGKAVEYYMTEDVPYPPRG